MPLTFYGHPLSSYCHKVLIALYETGAPFTFRQIDPSQQADRDLMASLTPMGKMPALVDDEAGVTLGESAIIIEWLDRHHPGPAPLLPRDPDAALQARTWNNIFDYHVMREAQQIVDARLFMDDAAEEPIGVFARNSLDRSYAAIDRHMAGREWAAGDFGLADCAAVPALFYAGFLHPFDDRPNLAAYFERLLARPSVARVHDEAKPWLQYFPFPERIPQRFR
ncbi:glutathione S-transferase family protein (plasmid) [Paracoccus sp. TK19116]|uniref:Glutathione S-transferase family protein n=1 Tax=Paracoccus albicereus TaxID=2922394 RepID=A0ABT1MN00_9RHOB|nr:glutathione S-transferase family protein [Paracoccus albicereus]MCQ0968976.1 glutathione S-transferase family protein [Paracoccus albicereus]